MTTNGKMLNKTLANKILQYNSTTKLRLFQEYNQFNVQKPINVFYHIKRIKEENKLTIFSTYTKRAFDKIQHPLMIKALRKLAYKGT